MNAMTARIKLLARMDVDREAPPAGRPHQDQARTAPADGRRGGDAGLHDAHRVRREDGDADLRSGHRRQAVRRPGLQRHEAERWQTLIQAHGIILVTGPTGSGKTTTLYSTLKKLATEQVNVSTIEDPIEMIEPAFNQMQVQPEIDLDFAAGLRSLMRQDPDIIMVGEIRDQETAEMAMQAALTGHLVLSTLHTNDAP